MKNLLFILFLLISCNINAQYNCNIKIIYVRFNIETIADVNCNDFEVEFESMYKSKIIKSKQDVKTIINLLNSIRVDTLNNPNVRAKLILCYPDKTKIYCISKNSICNEKMNYYLPDKLMLVLKKYMK